MTTLNFAFGTFPNRQQFFDGLGDSPATIQSPVVMQLGISLYGSAPWTLTNSGTLGASANPNFFGLYVSTGNVTNHGRILSGTNPNFAAMGAWGNGVTLTNDGVISGSLAGVYGLGFVYAPGASDTITNTGTIAGGIGIKFYSGNHSSQTVVNGGLISGGGGTAIQFTSGQDLLVLQPGAQFEGTIADTGQASRLELSGNTAGTLAGLATTFAPFGTINVDAGAIWTLGSASSLGSGVTLTNAGALTASLTLASGTAITNATTGTISSTAAGVAAIYASGGGVTVINAGTILALGATPVHLSGADNRLVLDAGAVAASAYGGGGGNNVLELAAGSIATGTLSGLGTAFTGFDRVIIDSGATWSLYGASTLNSGVTMSNAGALTGGATLNGSGLLSNALGGRISGASYGVLAHGAIGIVNAGSIVSGNDGINMTIGGSISNAAGGYIHGGVYGVRAVNVAVGITNAGTITGYLGVVERAGGVTLTNAGTIQASGGPSVYLFGSNNRLILDAGAVLIGEADGGHGGNNTLELAAGTAASGTLSNLDTAFVGFSAIELDSGANWTFTGSNTIASGTSLTNRGTLSLLGANLHDATALLNNGQIVIDPSTVTLASLVGFGSVTIDAGSTLEVQGSIASTETIVFNGSGGLLRLDTPFDAHGSVTGFGPGDTIDLAGVDPASVSYSGGMLHFVASTFGVSFPLSGTGSLQSASDGSGGASVALCFCAGTRIATPRGEVFVEDLRVGDMVVTVRGEARPLVWIGIGRVLVTRGHRSAATPVILRKGALADNVPYHDLRVTKGHSFLFDDVLIPVEFLVNHRSILWDDHTREVTIYHLELASHDVLLANGAPAESYRDDGNRWLFQNANSGWGLPPQEPCAPVLTGGPIVDAVWRRLLDRAGSRPGVPTTDDADLHLLADGRRIDPATRWGDRWIFRLRQVPRALRIVSRSGVPTELGLARDARALGVALRRIMLSHGAALAVIEADDPALTDGFHGFEAADGIRWTDGDAAVPAVVLAGFTWAVQVELQLGGSMLYPLLDEAQGRAA